MAANRTEISIAAQMVADRIPLPAYGYRINPALPLTIPRPIVPWNINLKGIPNGNAVDQSPQSSAEV